MECTEIDLNKVCRTCKTESPEMKSLYYRDTASGKENPRLDEMLMACTSVQVDIEDSLSKLICRSCFVQLKNAYTFKEQCEKTDVFLRNCLQNIENIKTENESDDLEFTIFEVVSKIKPTRVSDENANKDATDEIADDPKVQLEGKVEKENADDIQIINNNVTIYKCRMCSKECYTLEGLKIHERRHTNKTSKCKPTNTSYTRLNHLQAHQLPHAKRKMHVCKFCKKIFTRYDHLKHHLVTHMKSRPFPCPSCNRCFERVGLLEKHVSTCKRKRTYVCDICDAAFISEALMEVHKRKHEKKDPLLPTLKNLENIEEHYIKIEVDNGVHVLSDRKDSNVVEENTEPEVEISDNNDPVKIDEITEITNNICADEDSPEMLLEKVKIEEELLLVSGKDDDVAEEQAVETDNGSDYESNNCVHSKYKTTKQSTKGRKASKGCLIVEHSCKTEEGEIKYLDCSECKVHGVQHVLKLYECQTCKKQFSRSSNLKRHKLTHGEIQPFQCGTCKKTFLRRDRLEKHMKLHLSSAAFTCDLCQAVFNHEKGLAKHKACKHDSHEMMVVAAVEKKFKCQHCTKTFTTMKYRDYHSKTHFIEKKFQCKTCEKTFVSKRRLTQHMKFHTAKNFLCSECGQKFSTNDILIIHMRRHRGEKPCKCKFCGKGFARMSDLTVHERYHTGEKTHLCVVCGRGFVRAYSLTVHMRTHTGEKPYRCTYCDAAFAQGNDLKAHVRKHTGERFQCELCPDTFLVGYLLTQHKRVVHGLNIVSNITRLQPVKTLNPDDPPEREELE